MRDADEITILMSTDQCFWRCGDRVRKITRAQAGRVLAAAQARIHAYTIKDKHGREVSKLEVIDGTTP